VGPLGPTALSQIARFEPPLTSAAQPAPLLGQPPGFA